MAKVQLVESRGRCPGYAKYGRHDRNATEPTVLIRGWCGCTRKNMGVITILFSGNEYACIVKQWRTEKKKPIETNGEAYVSRFAVDLEHTTVNIIIANAVAIVDVNR